MDAFPPVNSHRHPNAILHTGTVGLATERAENVEVRRRPGGGTATGGGTGEEGWSAAVWRWPAGGGGRRKP
jgi:hypothetical protein